MKKKEILFDVDFIGGQNEALTKDEERAISEYLKNKKTSAKKNIDKTKRRSIKNSAAIV